MHHSINKKIFLHFLILILFASINNKNFLNSKILKLKDFSVFGLSEEENYDLKSKFINFENQNIFFVVLHSKYQLFFTQRITKILKEIRFRIY